MFALSPCRGTRPTETWSRGPVEATPAAGPPGRIAELSEPPKLQIRDLCCITAAIRPPTFVLGP
eukprot:8702168-Pyramimonas_sp.AAC.1